MVRAIKSERTRWAEHVARSGGGQERCIQCLVWGYVMNRTLGWTGVMREDYIEMDLQELEQGTWTGLVASCCEYGGEPSGFMKRVESLDWLHNC